MKGLSSISLLQQQFYEHPLCIAVIKMNQPFINVNYHPLAILSKLSFVFVNLSRSWSIKQKKDPCEHTVDNDDNTNLYPYRLPRKLQSSTKRKCVKYKLTAVVLIGSIIAVRMTIALPPCINALSAVTLKLVGRTFYTWHINKMSTMKWNATIHLFVDKILMKYCHYSLSSSSYFLKQTSWWWW